MHKSRAVMGLHLLGAMALSGFEEHPGNFQTKRIILNVFSNVDNKLTWTILFKLIVSI